LAYLVRLETLQEAVERERPRSPGAILIDEGPVFALTWMEVFYPDRNGPRFAAWRTQALAEWARTLDFVVSIDAPDPTLLHRMRTRPKHHVVKDAPTTRCAPSPRGSAPPSDGCCRTCGRTAAGDRDVRDRQRAA